MPEIIIAEVEETVKLLPQVFVAGIGLSSFCVCLVGALVGVFKAFVKIIGR